MIFEKIDAVSYSRQSRRLQEAQDYAERLIRPNFGEEAAKAIARDLVRNYPALPSESVLPNESLPCLAN